MATLRLHVAMDLFYSGQVSLEKFEETIVYIGYFCALLRVFVYSRCIIFSKMTAPVFEGSVFAAVQISKSE